jgi:PKD repeat protein
MTIPTASTYPSAIDTNQNLYQVRDSLRVRLIEDYNPGDTSITVLGDENMMRSFNATGIITLTDQCSDPELRAISFYYGSRTLTTFDQLEILPGFKDVIKPKNLTDVTQNVMSVHHNALKDALIAIEEFVGIQGKTAIRPKEGTVEERINYLRKIALSPKAWFTVDKTIGLAPLTVQFTDQSFRIGTDGTSQKVEYLWDFGDNSGPSITNVLESNNVNEVTKTYTKPGIYSVSLTITNDFGSDTITFPDLINAKFSAPDYAIINISGQGVYTSGLPAGGPYTIKSPKLRTTINTLIDVSIPSGINSITGKTYGGEIVDDSGNPIDPINNYTWSFSDDLTHNNSSVTKAVFSIGGVYDLILRVDTEFGAYRITQYPNTFDIVEKTNLWLWNYSDSSQSSVYAYEFGLISETFKTNSTGYQLYLNKNDSFLNGVKNETQQKREFNRNNGFLATSATPSGSGGLGLLYWASGRNTNNTSDEKILMKSFNGFLGIYEDVLNNENTIYRPWNWVGFNNNFDLYFILGGVNYSFPPLTSPTNQIKEKFDFTTNTKLPSEVLTPANYLNGANELIQNMVSYTDGVADQGNMSVYRSTWYGDAGYFLRNEGVGDFFRIKSFYKTTGDTTEPFTNIRKLPDMLGPAKLEGQLVSLSGGIYFFSNSGSISVYNPTTGIWATGGPGANASSFRLLQDSNVEGFDDADQTLLAASSGDYLAYLSFDYSPNAFIKFNEIDTTFSSVRSRPAGNQWQMCIF